MKRTHWLLVFLALAYWFGTPPATQAHALLLNSNPTANQILPTSPQKIELWLTEPVAVGLTEIRVLNSAGERVDDGATLIDPNGSLHVQVGLKTLPDGVYVVHWKALSQLDGHITNGVFPFAVGNVSEESLLAVGVNNSVPDATFSQVLARWLNLLGMALLIGWFAFREAVWRPEAHGMAGRAFLPVFADLQKLGAILFLLGSVLGLLEQAAKVTDASWLTALTAPALGDLLFGTRVGWLWLARVSFAILLLLSTEKVWQSVLQALFAVGLAVSYSLNSHLAAASPPWLPVFSNVLHILLASAWLGGAVYLFSTFISGRNLPSALFLHISAKLTTRFSDLALILASVVLLSGIYGAWLTVGSVSALTQSFYGQTLALKLILVLAIFAVAAVNLWLIRPRLQKAQAQNDVTAPQLLFKSLIGELSIAALLLLAAALFASLPLAKPFLPQLALSAAAEDLQLKVLIQPGMAGFNRFILTAEGDSGVLNQAKLVRLRFTPKQGAAVSSDLVLNVNDDGQFMAQGANLTEAGEWQVEAIVQRAGAYDAYASFDITLLAAAQSASNQILRWQWLSWVLLPLLGLAIALAMWQLPVGSGLRGSVGLVAIVALCFTAWAWSVRLGRPINYLTLVNPLPPTAEHIATGQALYQQHCLVCHGVQGGGDGPAGVILNPRPADLRIHFAPGAHPEGLLFDWISNGVPTNPQMPAFGSALTEEQRWQIMLYGKTLVR
ncbi:MAG TPA: copper resistance protein CopC [Anaerolineales bacterium]|nr:copper resistance protein CopC [Anaerolineales bacterium]